MIPDYLLTQIREGKAVLFLGSGASLDATDGKGNHPPTGWELGKLLSDQFLGGKYCDAPLAQIGEYAISESDVLTVQSFISDIFQPFKPTNEHLLIPTFRWFGIGSTNYDLLVEDAYKAVPDRVQNPALFIENSDRISDRLRDASAVPYLKIHGCITRLNNPHCPLILSTDQYIQHKQNRNRLFTQLQDWGVEHPIIFVGHSLQDPDIRAIMLELNELGDMRPRYYFVAPCVDEIQTRFWEANYKVTPIKATFAQFMSALDAQISKPLRGLAIAKTEDAEEFEISEKFAVHDWTLSTACKQFLKTDVAYVKGIIKTESIDPLHFYKGMNKGWSGVEQNLDVKRRLTDSILSEHFLIEESSHSDVPELIVLQSHAGGGKSITLRRMAWDAAKEFDCLCLWLNSHGVLSSAAIQELLTLCQERIYLFVDNAADRVREIASVIKQVGVHGGQLTVVTAERINEWNVSCSSLSPFVTEEYLLRYLSETEIDGLLGLLEKHKALGKITSFTPEERKKEFVDRAGRQLLVALHEATMGKPFEDIVLDEFNGITPHEAQQFYLTVCVLNRVGVPVRANLISRIHGLLYEDFQKRLFSPLAHIVHTKHDPVLRDYLYRTRHSHIAQIVFERALPKAEDRYDAYVRCLQHMSSTYDVDQKALYRLLRARSLIEVLVSHELIQKTYELAKKIMGDDDVFLLHQMALYEMNRPSGNIRKAGEFLTTAMQQAPYNRSVQHSLAEYHIRRADESGSNLERTRNLNEARKICSNLKSQSTDNSYAYHTLVKVGLLDLKKALEPSTDSDSELTAVLKVLESDLAEGLQKFPGDAHLLSAEADLAIELQESGRAQTALETSFNTNPRNGYVAIQLARIYQGQGNIEDATKALRKAIEANRNDRKLNFWYAQLLLEGNTDSNSDEIIYHLGRSFAPGDSNHQARLLLGRQHFITNDLDASKEIFRDLAKIRAPAEVRNRINRPINSEFRGTVTKLEATFCFIARTGTNDWIFTHRNNVPEEVWRQFMPGVEVTFKIGFTFRGPSAFDLSLI